MGSLMLMPPGEITGGESPISLFGPRESAALSRSAFADEPAARGFC